MVKTVAILAWKGYLTCMERMAICDVNISDIPRDQIEKLASIVTGTLDINNMTHADQLGSILASVRCSVLEEESLKCPTKVKISKKILHFFC